MEKQHKLILIGGGGHCIACIDVIEAGQTFGITGIVDMPQKVGDTALGYPVIACDDDLPDLVDNTIGFLITLGQLKSAAKRRTLFGRLTQLGASFPVIVSPIAYVSSYAAIGEGSIVMHRTVINAQARIGKNCIVNTGALVEHNAVVGDHCHLSTGSIVNGGCVLGDGVFLGSRSVLRNHVTVASDIVIGAGAVVVKDLQEPGVYAGNPARRLK